jgi:uncharacterized repeat protein (TIGR01451 family)
VTADNDPPTTSGIADVTVNEDAPDTVIDLFAAFDDVEDADDALTYTVQTNTNPGLFDATPIDGVAGTLTLDYKTDTAGSAQLTILVTDTGGASVDTTFTVTVRAAADLVVGKQAEPASAVPGRDIITYTLTTSNPGPSDADGAVLSDTIPAEIDSPTWVCVANGATCPSDSGSGNINETLNNLPEGSVVTYTITGTVLSSATGTLVNTASVTVPVGVLEINPTDNMTTTITQLVLEADLYITKTGDLAGTSITYTIVVSNIGPSDASGAAVSDTVPAGISDFTWSCAAAGGAACGVPPDGTGDINQAVNLPVGGMVTYTVTGTVTVDDTVVNTATVTAPAGVTEPLPGNNQAVDSSGGGSPPIYLPIILKNARP